MMTDREHTRAGVRVFAQAGPPNEGEGATPPSDFAFTAPNAEAIRNRDVWLAHPWSLADAPQGTTVVAVLDAAFHRQWPWSERRWRFVATRLASMTPHRWIAEPASLHAALAAARSVRGIGNLHLGHTFARFDLAPMPRAFDDPPRRCRSFSAFWNSQEQTTT